MGSTHTRHTHGTQTSMQNSQTHFKMFTSQLLNIFFNFFLKFILFYVNECFASVYDVCCILWQLSSEEGVRSQVLELQMVLTITENFWRPARALNHWTISPGLLIFSYIIKVGFFYSIWRFFLFKYYLILCVWVFHLHVCLCTMCMPCSLRVQERASNPLGMKDHCKLPCEW